LWITDDASGVRRAGVRTTKHLVDGRGFGLLNDSRGNIWVATTAQGLWQVHPGADGTPESVKQVTVQTGLLADEVSDFLEDRDGNIWVGAIRGISRLTPHKVQSLLDVGVVNALTADPKGTVWAGTTTGVVALPGTNARAAGHRTVIAADSVRTLHRDATGTIWAATREGLHRIVKGRLVPVPVEGATPTRITSIASDHSGAVWVSDEADGVLRLAGNHLERMTALTDGISARPIFLYADGMDQIWVAFDGGILRMRSRDGSRVQQYGPADGLLD
jgi:ligand-binding sensor domain-containing protein